MSKKSWVPSEKDYENIVEWMFKDGATESEVACRLGLHPSTLSKYKNDPEFVGYDELNDALKLGKQSQIAFAENKLWKMVVCETHKSHFSAVMAFLNRNDFRGSATVQPNAKPAFVGYQIEEVWKDENGETQSKAFTPPT